VKKIRAANWRIGFKGDLHHRTNGRKPVGWQADFHGVGSPIPFNGAAGSENRDALYPMGDESAADPNDRIRAIPSSGLARRMARRLTW